MIGKMAQAISSCIIITLLYPQNFNEDNPLTILIQKRKKLKMPYPRMFTNKSSAALWMWKTSSRKRERQELLWRASFQRFSAVVSVLRIPWHKIKPTLNKKSKYKYKSFPKLCYFSYKISFQKYRTVNTITKLRLLSDR